MIQVYSTNEHDFINEHRDYNDNDLALIGTYIQNLLKRKETHKVVIKKFR